MGMVSLSSSAFLLLQLKVLRALPPDVSTRPFSELSTPASLAFVLSLKLTRTLDPGACCSSHVSLFLSFVLLLMFDVLYAMVCLWLTIGPLGPLVIEGLVRVSLVPRVRVRINSRSQICLSFVWFYFQEVSFGNLLPIILLCVRNMEYYRFADNNWGYLPFSISKLHPHLFLVRS